MYGNISKDEDSIWCISAYGAWKDTAKRRYHMNRNIIAKTMEEAIEKLRETEPDVKLVSINHKGVVDAR